MKKFITITMGALVAFTVAATSITAPAHAGKRERVAAGVILGAIGGAIIAGEIHRSKKRRTRRARHYRGDRYYNRRNNYQRRSYSRSYRQPSVNYERFYGEPRDETLRQYKPRRRYNDRRYRYNNSHVYRAPRPRLSRYQRHVKRCYAAYRTYDKRSDTFIGYDGNEHKCRK